MATFLLSNAKVLLLSLPSTSSTSSSSSSSPSTFHTQPQQQIVCKSAPTDPSSTVTTRRNISLSLSTAAAAFLSAANYMAGAAILEADEDDELMEKVKRDRKKRIDKQGIIVSSAKERAYLQELIYKLSKVGESIEKKDLSEANSVLGSSNDSEWLQKLNFALNKLSSSEEEKTEADIFNISLVSLLSSISRNDVEASKIAFVASASAFEKWTTLSGLAEQLKGL